MTLPIARFLLSVVVSFVIINFMLYTPSDPTGLHLYTASIYVCGMVMVALVWYFSKD